MRVFKLVLLLVLFVELDAKESLDKTKMLYKAIEKNDISRVEELINTGADIKEVNRRGGVLHKIRKKHSLSFLEYLLSKGADVNAVNYKNETILHIYSDMSIKRDPSEHIVLSINGETKEKEKRDCKEFKLDFIKLLVEKGADINAVRRDGKTPISLAFSDKKDCLVKYYLDQGADPKKGTNPLFSIGWSHSLPIINSLIQHGYNVNEISKEYPEQSALYNLARNGNNLKAIALLLNNGADINLENKNHDTALTLSYKNRHADELISFLLKHGAKKSEKYYKLKLYNLFKYADKEEILDYLSRHNTLIKDDIVYEKALSHASQRGLLFLKILLEKRGDTNFKTLIYAKTLKESLKAKQFDVINYLLSKDLDLSLLPDNKEFAYIKSILGLAVESDDFTVLKLIVKKGYAVSKDNSVVVSPIYLATKKDNIEMVKFLIKQGANVTQLYSMDKSLLDIAIENKSDKLIKLFNEIHSNLNLK